VRRGGGRYRRQVLAVGAVVIVLGSVFLARDRILGWLDPLEAPDALAGLPAVPASSPEASALRSVTDQLVADVGPDGIVQVYGDGTETAAVLAASRGAVDPAQTREYVAAFGMPVVTVGATTCGTDEHDDLSVCMRTGAGRTVAVLLLGRHDLTPDAAIAAAWRGTS
jgi:hypothetical protein